MIIKKLNTPLLVTGLFMILHSIVHSIQYFDYTTSHSKMQPFQIYVIPAIILLFSLYFTYYSLYILLYDTIKLYAMFNSLFISYYIFVLVIAILDLQNIKETSQHASQYLPTTYVFNKKPVFNETIIQGAPINLSQQIVQQLRFMLVRCRSFYIVIFVWFLIFIVLLLGIYIIKKAIFDKKRKSHSKNKDKRQIYQFLYQQLQKYQTNSFIKIILSIIKFSVFIATTIIFICYMTSDYTQQFKYQQIVSGHWIYYRSSIQIKFKNLKQYQSLIQLFRIKFTSEDNQDWLDQRNPIQYPLVRANKQLVCKFNFGNADYCNQTNKLLKDTSETPNVVLLILESLTPSPVFYNKNILQSSDYIVNGPMYNELFHNMNHISENSVNYAGLSSNSLPTVFGWLDLVAGISPYLNNMNIVDQMYDELDDLPTFFKQQNYTTQYVSSTPINFDGENQFVFRGRGVVDKSISKINTLKLNNYSKWFDGIINYMPDQTQQKFLNLTLSDHVLQQPWINDRITAKQFIYYFNQSKLKYKKPLFQMLLTIDNHTPFVGYDDQLYYTQFSDAIKNYQLKHQSNQTFSDEYNTIGKMNKYIQTCMYTDQQIGSIVEYLKQNYNNTILVITGDHGVREVPFYQKTLNDIIYKNNETIIKYDTKHNFQSYSNDQQFVTSAMISYLGDDQKYKQKFQNLKNKTYKFSSDHQDLHRTIQSLIDPDLPYSILGRDLLKTSNNYMLNQQSNHFSMRLNQIHFEVAEDDMLFRSHVNSYKNSLLIQNTTFPTNIYVCDSNQSNCSSTTYITNQTNTEKKQLYQQFLKFKKLIDYTQQNNQIFNYQFRQLKDMSYLDIYQNFYTQNDQIKMRTNDCLSFMGVFTITGFLTGIAFEIIIVSIKFKCKCFKKQDKQAKLNNDVKEVLA